jgi:thiamine-phosphate pyrophosphorylase
MHHKDYSIFCYISDYDKNYIKNLDQNVNIIFRNYTGNPNIKKLKEFKDFCSSINHKIYLANNMRLALNLKFDGVYIPSFNKKLNFTYKKNTKNFKIIGSAHNLSELKIKEKQGVELIFISPLFKIKKNKSFLNITRFNLLTLKSNKKVIALGGILKKNLNKLKLIKASGFAGISYFKNNDKINV